MEPTDIRKLMAGKRHEPGTGPQWKRAEEGAAAHFVGSCYRLEPPRPQFLFQCRFAPDVFHKAASNCFQPVPAIYSRSRRRAALPFRPRR